jgi:hypothetical protein
VRWTVLTVVLAAVVAGCGGGESASLTHAQWANRADGACKRAGQAIVERGWAGDLRALQTVAADAVADVRKAISEIRRLPSPPGAAARVRPFIATLGDLEPLLDDLVRASTAMDTADLRWIATHLRGKLSSLESSGRGAGLRWCMQHDEPRWVPDGIRAPLVAEGLAQIDRTMPARVDGTSVKAYRRLSAALSDQAAALALLDPPLWAQSAMTAYEWAVRDYASIAARAAAGGLERRTAARAATAAIRMKRLRKRLMRELRAAPVGVAEAVPDESA